MFDLQHPQLLDDAIKLHVRGDFTGTTPPQVINQPRNQSRYFVGNAGFVIMGRPFMEHFYNIQQEGSVAGGFAPLTTRYPYLGIYPEILHEELKGVVVESGVAGLGFRL